MRPTSTTPPYATFELEGGAIAHINCSWCVRVRRDDLVTFQADGTHGLDRREHVVEHVAPVAQHVEDDCRRPRPSL